MSENYEVVKCTCGQLNRRRRGELRAHACGKCGAPLISDAQTAPKRKRPSSDSRISSIPIVLCALILGGVYLAYSNDLTSSNKTSAPAGPNAKPATPPNVPPAAPSVPRKNATLAPTFPAPLPTLPVPPRIERPPDIAQSLELPDRPPPKITHNDVPAQPVAEMLEPAPGCPQKFRTYETARAICRGLERFACQSVQDCSWSDSQNCVPKLGTFIAHDPRYSRQDNALGYVEAITVEMRNRIDIADRYVARGLFEKAISIYTQILQHDPDAPSALNQRAIAFEKMGRKDRALADYCKLLVIQSTNMRADDARKHIALLTGKPIPDGQSSVTTNAGLPLPSTGDLVSRRKSGAIAPFKVVTARGSNYLVKLVSVENSKDQIWIFVRGGDPYSTTVPLGTYTLRIASGDTWFGRNDLFGPDTRFFRLRAKQGAADVSMERLQFTRTITRTRTRGGILVNTQTTGVTIDLQGSIAGNLEQEAMSRKDFDAE
jgi:hypothetical protein